MSQFQSTEGDLKFLEDFTETTKTKVIELNIEDFLAKLNNAVQRQAVDEDFIESPGFFIGDQALTVGFSFDEDNRVVVNLCAHDFSNKYRMMSMLMTGICGNLALKEEFGSAAGFRGLELGSIAELKEAMTTSGNHKLDLQVTLTALLIDNDQWIIPK